MNLVIKRLVYLYAALLFLYIFILFNPEMSRKFYQIQTNLWSRGNIFLLEKFDNIRKKEQFYFFDFNRSSSFVDGKLLNVVDAVFDSKFDLLPLAWNKPLEFDENSRVLTLFADAYSSNEMPDKDLGTIAQAKALMRNNDNAQAEKMLLNLIQKNDNEDAKGLLSTLYIKEERFKEAKKLFGLKEEMISFVDSFPVENFKEPVKQKKEIPVQKKKIQAKSLKIKKEIPQKIVKKEEKKTSSLKIAKVSKKYKSVESAYQQSLQLIKVGNYIQARKLLENNIYENQFHMKSRLKLIEVLIYLKDFQESRKLIGKTIELEPNNVDLQLHLANIYVADKKYKMALSVLEKMPIEVKNKIKYAAILANVYLNLHNYQGSLELYQRLIKHDIRNNSWGIGLALSYEGVGDKRNAYNVFHEVGKYCDDPNVKRYITSKLKKLSSEV